MDAVTNILSSLDSNTLSTIANLGNQTSAPIDSIKNLFTPSAPVPQLQTTQVSLANADIEFEADISTLRNIGIILTIALLFWTIFLVMSEYLFKDTKFKENVKYTNDILFGTSGFLNNLFMVWVIILAAIYIIYGLQFVSAEIISVNKGLANTIGSSIPLLGKIISFFKQIKL